MEQLKEYFKVAIKNLRTRSLRSWLTILGIVIGVFLIVSLLSLSEGLKATITKQLKSLGGEMIIIMPGDISNPMSMFMGGGKLESEDVEVVKRTENVESVLPMAYQNAVARYGEESKTIFLAGVPWKEGEKLLRDYQGWSFEEGTWPSSGKKEVIVGQQIAKDLFEEKVRVNTEIKIKGKKFTVVGILNSLGSKSDDSYIYMDSAHYESLTGEKRGTAQMLWVKITDGSNVDKAAQDIKENLQKTRKRRSGTDDLDFSVLTSEKMGDIAGSVLAIIQVAIIAFAGIAILVGGIGITNTMFTSVRERTREIGIMKAIGAKNSAILTIFLFESGIIGAIGGLGGTILGVILAKAIEAYGQVHPVFYFSASITPGLILFGLLFSFTVGCISGFLPARQAAKLKPVEALRRVE